MRHLVPWPSTDIHRKFYGDRPRGTPPPGELNTRGVAKYCNFGPIECYISETVQAIGGKLVFAAGAVTYSKQQVHDLNVCWNTMYRTVFNFNRWESVKGFINGLGKLSLQYILKIC